MPEKKIVSELKRCLCEEQERVIKYSLMTKESLSAYGVASDFERQKFLARATGARNAYIKALRLLGIDKDTIQTILEGVQIKARGEIF